MASPSISVVIPTLNCEEDIDALLNSLENQTWKPNEIIVVDSSSTDSTAELATLHDLVRFISIKRTEFNHGTTRNFAFQHTMGDFILFMTQDSIPRDDKYIENLMRPFCKDNVALVYGRQVPKSDARRYVQLVQEFNYPDVPCVKTKDDVKKFGLKTYFCSDVCSAYRRDSLEKIGGIPNPCSTNEDMLAAARLIQQGYSVAYEPSAAVIHSHNLTPLQQFKRNKAVGHFLREHSEELNVPSEVGEGMRLAKKVFRQLVVERCIAESFEFAVDCVARLLGNRAGRLG